jgi:hypothetical protein
MLPIFREIKVLKSVNKHYFGPKKVGKSGQKIIKDVLFSKSGK